MDNNMTLALDIKNNIKDNLTDRQIPSIDIFRYVCAIMVVAIHTRPLEEISTSLSFIVTDIISCIAVPFFSLLLDIFICLS